MTDEWVAAFESRLEQLEQSASRDQSLPVLLDESVAALNTVGDVSAASLFIVRRNDIERLAASGTAPGVVTAEQVRRAVGQPATTVRTEDAAAIADCPPTRATLLSRPLADDIHCLLALVRSGDATDDNVPDAGHAVLNVLAEIVSRRLVSEYEMLLARQQSLTTLAMQLSDRCTVADLASAIVEHVPSVIGDCRVSFVEAAGTGCRVIAVTGADSIHRNAESIQAIQTVAASSGQLETQPGRPGSAECEATELWVPVAAAAAAAPRDAAGGDEDVARAIATLQSNNVATYRTLHLTTRQQDADSVSHLLFVELFANTAPPREAVVEQLLQVCRSRLAAVAPAARADRQQRLRRRVLGGVAAVVAAMLMFFPVRFDIEVSGQILPRDRRRIFAPENGVVTDVRFQQDQLVDQGDVLLILASADLEMQQQQLQGEIDTTIAELAAIRTARVTDRDVPASTGNAQQSSAEQLLELRLRNLSQQQMLLNSRCSKLHVAADVAGHAFRREPAHELLSRPVQRGQLLLEIIPRDGSWQLELHVTDELIGYLNSYRLRTDRPVKVQYMLPSQPDRRHSAVVTHVDSAMQILDGQLVCVVLADVAEGTGVDLRPGSSVSAHLECGRRPLGFVLFRELVEFWQQFRFSWL